MQVVACPDRTPLCFSRALPGRTHDLTAARAHGVIQACIARQISSSPTGPTKVPTAPSAPLTTVATCRTSVPSSAATTPALRFPRECACPP
ncbi:hypothetical protein ACR820_34280 [Streptomyces netropsis]